MLPRYQQFSSHKSEVIVCSTPKHHSQVSDSPLFQKKQGGSANRTKSVHQEAVRPPKVLCSMKLWQMTISKEDNVNRYCQCHQQGTMSTKPKKSQQRVARQTNAIHCLLSYISTLSKPHVFSQESTIGKHHMPSFQTALRKTPHVSSRQNILSFFCFCKNILLWNSIQKNIIWQNGVRQRIQKFPLQVDS